MSRELEALERLMEWHRKQTYEAEEHMAQIQARHDVAIDVHKRAIAQISAEMVELKLKLKEATK